MEFDNAHMYFLQKELPLSCIIFVILMYLITVYAELLGFSFELLQPVRPEQ